MSHIFGLNVDFNYNQTLKQVLENQITFPTLTASEAGFVFYHSANQKFYGWDGSSWLDFTAAGGGGGTTWGTITGTLSSQTDLQSALDAKLSLSGGTMTGTLNMGDGSLTNIQQAFVNDALFINYGVGNYANTSNGLAISAQSSGDILRIGIGTTGATDNARFNFASITGTQTFTFPNASGTIALEGSFLETGTNIISGTLQFKDSGTNQGFFMDSTTNQTYIEGGSVGNASQISLDDNQVRVSILAGTGTRIVEADLNGDLSATNSLSDYVDRTSTQTVGGLKSFSSAIHAQAGRIIFNDDASTVGYASGGSMGYLGLSQYYFHQDHVTVAQAAGILDFDSLTVDRIYTFPDSAGTLALEGSFVELTGNQSVGGAKTFTSSCVFNSTIRMPISTKAGGSTGVGGFGYIGTDQYIFYKDAEGRGMIFDFSLISAGALDRTYTFQNANGTLAFTSDIPAIASQAQAEAGTDNTTIMTPLRVQQAINENAVTIVEGSVVNPNFTGGPVDTVIISAPGAGNIIEIIEAVIFVSNWSATGAVVQGSVRYTTAGVNTTNALNISSGTVSNINTFAKGSATVDMNEADARNDSVTLRLTNTTAETTTGTIYYRVTYRVWTPV